MKESAGNGVPAVRLPQASPNAGRASQGLLEAGDNSHSLSLVIPAWNECETIQQAIHEADAALSEITADYEIIIVDDGSSDHTADLVEELATSHPHLRLVQHGDNRGYGAALRTGFEAARFGLVAFTDADCQFDLSELEYMLPLSRHYHVTTGYRIERQEGTRRRFFSWGYNTLVKLLIGSPVHDIDCALKVFQRDRLQDILPESKNFFANTEMLTRARARGLSVVEVGVHHRARAAGDSKVSLFDIPKTLGSLLPFWWSQTMFPARRALTCKYDGWFWLSLFLLALIAGSLLFPNLGYALVEPDEGRYAEIGREMLRSGNWIVPTLNQEPYYDKPPLLYWFVAASLHVFGVHEWAARLVPALAAFLTVLATFFFAKRWLGTRAGFLSALALSLTAVFIQCGRFLVLDSVLALFVALALFSGYEAMRGPRLHWRWWMASAVCCGLGVLTKGPVALVLFAPPVAAFAWLHRDAARLRVTHWLGYAGAVAALAAPWFIAVSIYAPDFAYQFFVEHHLKRFFGEEYHDSPMWFYIPVLLVGCLPWSLLVVPFARFLFSRAQAVASFRFREMGFCLLWAGWCVLFFSLSRGKLPPYILPAIPALAVLIGCYLETALFQPGLAAFFKPVRTQMPRWAVTIVGLAFVAANIWAWSTGSLRPRFLGVMESGLALAGIVALALWGKRLSWKPAWALCCLVTFAAIFETSSRLLPAWASRRSPLARADAVEQYLHDGQTAVLCSGEEWGSVPFRVDLAAPFLNTKGHSPAELVHFLCDHPRNVFIVKPGYEAGITQCLTPLGLEVTSVVKSAQARIYIIQHAAEQSLPRQKQEFYKTHGFSFAK